MRLSEFISEHKKGRRAVKHNTKPRTGHAPTQTGAGAHKDKKKAEKQGDVKHKKAATMENMSERFRDPEDWDEGNTEPPNNFAVYINGKKWKVFAGRGTYADDFREKQHYQQLKAWADKKSAATGKKWTVHTTGEAPTA